MEPVLHYRPAEGWLGDVHPIFREGKWRVYYLEIPLEPMRYGLYRLISAEIGSSDLLHWTTTPIRHTGGRHWWAIANFIVGNRIYSFYNGDKGFDLATSDDGKTWTPHPENPVVPYPAQVNGQRLEIRDPAIFRDDRTGKYYFISAAKKLEGQPHPESGLYLYATSSDLVHWTPLVPLYDPGNIGIPECPEMFQANGKYYLIGSWGIDRVGQGRYRIADRPEGPWRTPPPDIPDTLDSTEIMAPNTGFDGKRRLFMGWTPTYIGRTDFAPYEWGGHFNFPRELYAGAEGGLYLRLPKEFLALRTRTIAPRLTSARELRGRWSPAPRNGLRLQERERAGAFLLAGNHRLIEIEATLNLSSRCQESGVLFGTDDAGRGGYVVSIDPKRQILRLTRQGERERSLAITNIRVRPNAPLHLRVFLDGEMIEAFLDDKFALGGRIQDNMRGNRVGFFADGGAAEISLVRLHPLRPIRTTPLLREMPVRPAPDAFSSPGNAALFASARANVYAPPHPALDFTDSFTLTCWLKVTPDTGGFKANLIAHGDGPDANYLWGLNITAQRGLELYVKTADGYEGHSSSPNSFSPVEKEGRWIHAAGVMDRAAKEIRLYRDGKLLTKKTIGEAKPAPAKSASLRLGYAAGLPNADCFFGLIDEVKIGNRPLSEAEIRALASGVGTGDERRRGRNHRPLEFRLRGARRQRTSVHSKFGPELSRIDRHPFRRRGTFSGRRARRVAGEKVKGERHIMLSFAYFQCDVGRENAPHACN